VRHTCMCQVSGTDKLPGTRSEQQIRRRLRSLPSPLIRSPNLSSTSIYPLAHLLAISSVPVLSDHFSSFFLYSPISSLIPQQFIQCLPFLVANCALDPLFRRTYCAHQSNHH